MQLSIIAAPAAFDLQRWEAYVEGHTRILQKMSIDALSSAGKDWIRNPHVYLVTATDEDGEIVGGAKLHTYHPEFALPVESVVQEMIPDIGQRVQAYAQQGVGEICGLWTEGRVSRIGLAHYLTRAAIALCGPLGIRTIIGVGSPLTIRTGISLGYARWTLIGDNGDFAYPSPRFTSTGVIIEDAFTLPHAMPEHRARTFDLRVRPTQIFTESHVGIDTQIYYDLRQVVTDSLSAVEQVMKSER